eukprot:2727463-Ditylum_brightwellii.AAC.1
MEETNGRVNDPNHSAPYSWIQSFHFNGGFQLHTKKRIDWYSCMKTEILKSQTYYCLHDMIWPYDDIH